MKKLLEFQKKVGAIAKDSVNPFFKSNYFDINKLIEEVKPILNEVGLVITQPLTTVDGRLAIKTILIDIESDKELITEIAILPENPDPQKMGSIITYFRRYALQSLLFLQAEDDDANNAKSEPKIFNPSYKKHIEGKEVYECNECGAIIDETVYNYSKSKLGKPLCRDCQKK